MGKIQDAQAAVQAIEAEIAELRAQVNQHMAEAKKLQGSTDVEEITRRMALAEAAATLRKRLPIAGAVAGAGHLPELQRRLNAARAALVGAKNVRHNMAAEVKTLEKLAAQWSEVLPVIEKNLAGLLEAYGKAREYPPDLPERTLRGRMIWAQKLQQRLARLPAVRAELASYGPDPSAGPPTEREQLDDAFERTAGRLPEVKQAREIEAEMRDIDATLRQSP